MSHLQDSDPRAPIAVAADAPNVEPWLKISLVAFVPLVLAFYLPDEWQSVLFVAGGLLVLAGIAALVRQERRKSSDTSM
ncbi:MAG: hypothetical protein ABI601_10640 [bacterium]